MMHTAISIIKAKVSEKADFITTELLLAETVAAVEAQCIILLTNASLLVVTLLVFALKF